MFRIFRRYGACVLAVAALGFSGVAHAGSSEKVLYDFKGRSDGGTPFGTLVFDSNGNLYGAAGTGGKTKCDYNRKGELSSCGVIFKLTPKGTETALYTFQGVGDGANPTGGLIADKAGNFYGTTAFGGMVETHCKDVGCGTVFKLTPGGTETTLHAFTAGSDGQAPLGGVVADSAGNLYGTTLQGGSSERCGSDAVGCGTVFEIAAGGGETVLHAFTGASDGAYPAGGLIADGSGNLYGTTAAGGSTDSCGTAWEGCGTVFKVASDGSVSLLHVFSGGSDGAYPAGALIEDNQGNLYGTTGAGGGTQDCGEGPHGCGTVFKLSSDGTMTILHAFAGGSDGSYPLGTLVSDGAGNLYGTTGAGGSKTSCGKLGLLPKAKGCGTLFEVSAGGKESVLHVFEGKKGDGAYPVTGLIADSGANLYGMTFGGGDTKGCSGGAIGNVGCGTVFEIKE